MTARILNVLLGTWLMLSTFAWQHTHGQRLAGLLCGGLTVVLSLATNYFSGLRYFVAVVAVMLFVTAITSASHWGRTFWHNAIIAVAIFVSALLDRGATRTRPSPRLAG